MVNPMPAPTLVEDAEVAAPTSMSASEQVERADELVLAAASGEADALEAGSEASGEADAVGLALGEALGACASGCALEPNTARRRSHPSIRMTTSTPRTAARRRQ
jgi:hypothetical protein